MDLNRAGPLTLTLFSAVNAAVLHDPGLAESRNTEPQIQKNHRYGGLTISYTQIFDCEEGGHHNPQVVQESTVYDISSLM